MIYLPIPDHATDSRSSTPPPPEEVGHPAFFNGLLGGMMPSTGAARFEQTMAVNTKRPVGNRCYTVP